MTHEVNDLFGPTYTQNVDLIDQNPEDRIIAQAIAILDKRVDTHKFLIGSPTDSKDYLRLKLHGRPAEVFAVLWMDNRHRVIVLEELFQGTVDGAHVYPREVVRAAIKHNAVAAIFCHLHPSGDSTPSAADRAMTRELVDALGMIGTRVLDHIIIGDGEPTSMASMGLM